MISNCGHDENGRYSGGKAGDQTGTEWRIIPWYNRPWNCVLRHPDANIRQAIADMATKAANNNKIGYDQSQRYTYWQQLKSVGYDPSKITVACETDCSDGVISNVKAVGYKLNINSLKNINATYTGNMRQGFKNAGFQVLTDSKYLTSDNYLLPGDILLNDAHHTATNLTKGSKVSTTSSSTNTSSSTSKKMVSACKVTLYQLGKGDKHAQVKTVQRLLNSLNYKGKNKKSLTVDGDFGDNTAYAVKAFQKANKLTIDGIVGANTWKALFKA